MNDLAETVLAQLHTPCREIVFRTPPYYAFRADDEQVVRRFAYIARLRRTSACRAFLVEACNYVDHEEEGFVDEDPPQGAVWYGVASFTRAAPAVRLMMLVGRAAGGARIQCWIDRKYVAAYDSAEEIAEAIEAIVL